MQEEFHIPVPPEIPRTDWSDMCLKLDDGRVWSTKRVDFVDAEFVEAWKERTGATEVRLCQENQESGAHDEAGLAFQLSFFGCPLGQLGTEEERFASLRRLRDEMLALTDFAVLPDSALPEEALAQIRAYRASLRDLPNQLDAPFDGGYAQTPWPVLDETSTMSQRDPLVQAVVADLPPKKYHQEYDLGDLLVSPVFSARVQLKRFMGAAKAEEE